MAQAENTMKKEETKTFVYFRGEKLESVSQL